MTAAAGKGLRRAWLACAVLVAPCLQTGFVQAQPTQEQLHVVRVYSATRIRLSDGRRIRYAGITAPDRGKPFFDLCRQANRRLIDNATITVVPVGPARAGRRTLPARVYAGTRSVSAELVRQGYALVDTTTPDSARRQRLRALQREARAAGRGLWAFAAVVSEPYYIGERSAQVFHRPGCFHARHTDFEDRVVFRSIEEAIAAGFLQDWRCCPLFDEPSCRPGAHGE